MDRQCKAITANCVRIRISLSHIIKFFFFGQCFVNVLDASAMLLLSQLPALIAAKECENHVGTDRQNTQNINNNYIINIIITFYLY